VVKSFGHPFDAGMPVIVDWNTEKPKGEVLSAPVVSAQCFSSGSPPYGARIPRAETKPAEAADEYRKPRDWSARIRVPSRASSKIPHRERLRFSVFPGAIRNGHNPIGPPKCTFFRHFANRKLRRPIIASAKQKTTPCGGRSTAPASQS